MTPALHKEIFYWHFPSPTSLAMHTAQLLAPSECGSVTFNPRFPDESIYTFVLIGVKRGLLASVCNSVPSLSPHPWVLNESGETKERVREEDRPCVTKHMPTAHRKWRHNFPLDLPTRTSTKFWHVCLQRKGRDWGRNMQINRQARPTVNNIVSYTSIWSSVSSKFLWYKPMLSVVRVLLLFCARAARIPRSDAYKLVLNNAKCLPCCTS